ncbi:unnamed protein product [Rotaria sp. Silwood1]|nr:unnamed protein product [Rotaria sp. Silwood1]CAF3537747.1 unnamed protein product [Rotaria sp. Silwood1]CAF4890948.1 unnamed protein product [Rotaria sp. Silwood1]
MRGIQGISTGSDGNGTKSSARETNRVQLITSPNRYRTNPASVVQTNSYRFPDEIEICAGPMLVVYYFVNEINENIHLEKNIEDEGQRLNVTTVNDFVWRKRKENQDIYRQTSYNGNRPILY